MARWKWIRGRYHVPDNDVTILANIKRQDDLSFILDSGPSYYTSQDKDGGDIIKMKDFQKLIKVHQESYSRCNLTRINKSIWFAVKIWVFLILYKWNNETNIALYRSAVNVYVLNVNSIQNVCRSVQMSNRWFSFVFNHFLFLHPNKSDYSINFLSFQLFKKGCGMPNIRSPFPPYWFFQIPRINWQ